MQAAQFHENEDPPFAGQAEYSPTIDADGRPRTLLRTPNGWALLDNGAWIVQDANGSFYPVDEALFGELYS